MNDAHQLSCLRPLANIPFRSPHGVQRAAWHGPNDCQVELRRPTPEELDTWVKMLEIWAKEIDDGGV